MNLENIEYIMPEKDIEEYESHYLYQDILSHLQHMYTGKRMFYVSPHGGFTPIVIKEVVLTTDRKTVDDCFFSKIGFKVLSKNNNVYSMDYLYFGMPDADSLGSLYAACEYSNK